MTQEQQDKQERYLKTTIRDAAQGVYNVRLQEKKDLEGEISIDPTKLEEHRDRLADLKKRLQELKRGINTLTEELGSLEDLGNPAVSGIPDTQQTTFQKGYPYCSLDREVSHPGLDYDRGVKIHGANGYVLTGDVARLEREILGLAMNTYTQQGYTEVNVPLLVRPAIAEQSGHLPKFADDMFQVGDGSYLVPTAEMPLVGLHSQENLPEEVAYVACTPCFRNESIPYGKKNHGLKRVHYFNKVELFHICTPENAEQQFGRLQEVIKGFIETLEATYDTSLVWRVVELAADDLGFSAAHTFDIEVWLPKSQQWLEVASISNCTDFQAKRAKIKINKKYAFTLNGTGAASGRLAIALLESGVNNQKI